MPPLIRSKATVIWLILLAATGLSLALTDAEGSHLATMAVIVIAFFKVRLVGLHFMELSTAILPLRIVFEAWVVVICAVVLSLYWSGLA